MSTRLLCCSVVLVVLMGVTVACGSGTATTTPPLPSTAPGVQPTTVLPTVPIAPTATLAPTAIPPLPTVSTGVVTATGVATTTKVAVAVAFSVSGWSFGIKR